MDNGSFVDFYELLQLSPNAEAETVQRVFRILAQRYHPDRFAGSANEANRKMAEINEAYGVLSDPVKRPRPLGACATASTNSWPRAPPGA